VAIIMATARGEEIDRVVGFELGADDYVVKPYSVRELSLRIRAVLRRRGGEAAERSAVVQLGTLRIDRAGHRAWDGERELPLTALEFKLLLTFVGRRGRVQTREALLDEVWGVSSDNTTRTVDTHVKRLRQKLGAIGDALQTVRGVGYRWRAGDDEPTP
jgi:two-component system phosphate regulon response regulator PhoB